MITDIKLVSVKKVIGDMKVLLKLMVFVNLVISDNRYLDFEPSSKSKICNIILDFTHLRQLL